MSNNILPRRSHADANKFRAVLPLDFLRAKRRDMVWIVCREKQWYAICGETVLRRPEGNVAFASLEETMGALSCIGIEAAFVDRDGLALDEPLQWERICWGRGLPGYA